MHAMPFLSLCCYRASGRLGSWSRLRMDEAVLQQSGHITQCQSLHAPHALAQTRCCKVNSGVQHLCGQPHGKHGGVEEDLEWRAAPERPVHHPGRMRGHQQCVEHAYGFIRRAAALFFQVGAPGQHAEAAQLRHKHRRRQQHKQRRQRCLCARNVQGLACCCWQIACKMDRKLIACSLLTLAISADNSSTSARFNGMWSRVIGPAKATFAIARYTLDGGKQPSKTPAGALTKHMPSMRSRQLRRRGWQREPVMQGVSVPCAHAVRSYCPHQPILLGSDMISTAGRLKQVLLTRVLPPGLLTNKEGPMRVLSSEPWSERVGRASVTPLAQSSLQEVRYKSVSIASTLLPVELLHSCRS